MVIPGLGDEADRVGVRVEQRGEARIVGGRAARPLVMPKAVKVASISRLLAEQFGVERIGAGIAAFDVIDAEPVEQAGDRRLSASEKSTPFVCAPSRRVVSNR